MTTYSMYFTPIASNLPIQPSSYISTEEHMIQSAKFKNKNLRAGDWIAKFIKESKGDSFVFITTQDQRDAWNNWIVIHGLKEHISYEMPRPVTNGNHPHNGRNLHLRILKSL
jgi:hypothetical protein